MVPVLWMRHRNLSLPVLLRPLTAMELEGGLDTMDRNARQPCQTCRGKGIDMFRWGSANDCLDCHGEGMTGR